MDDLSRPGRQPSCRGSLRQRSDSDAYVVEGRSLSDSKVWFVTYPRISNDRNHDHRLRAPPCDFGGEAIKGVTGNIFELTRGVTQLTIGEANWRDLCPELVKLEKSLAPAKPIGKKA